MSSDVGNEKHDEALKEEAMSNERAAKISNSSSASNVTRDAHPAQTTRAHVRMSLCVARLRATLHLMTRHHVHRLPVVEHDGTFVGIVAHANIARDAFDAQTRGPLDDISK